MTMRPDRDRHSLSLVLSDPGSATRSAFADRRALEQSHARVHARGGPPLERIVTDEGGRLSFIATVDIQCIEARGDLIVIHTAKESHLLRATLQSMEVRLQDEAFLRIHRSILVNSRAIREMRRTPRGDFVLTLANGQQYASSAGHRQVVLDYISRCRP
jgi:DNA-binding LytR/AlgR family response regulator